MIELNELISGLEVMVDYEMDNYKILAHKQMIRQGITNLRNLQRLIELAENGKSDKLTHKDILRVLANH